MTPDNKKLYSLLGVLVAAIAGGAGADAAGYTPDLAAAIRQAPIMLVLVIYLELRWRPLAATIARFAARELGEDAIPRVLESSESLIDQVSTRIERAQTNNPQRKSGPVGVVKGTQS